MQREAKGRRRQQSCKREHHPVSLRSFVRPALCTPCAPRYQARRDFGIRPSRRNQIASDTAAEHRAHTTMNRTAACARRGCFQIPQLQTHASCSVEQPVCAAKAPVVRIQQLPAPFSQRASDEAAAHRSYAPLNRIAARARCIRAQAPQPRTKTTCGSANNSCAPQ